MLVKQDSPLVKPFWDFYSNEYVLRKFTILSCKMDSRTLQICEVKLIGRSSLDPIYHHS